MPELSAPAPAKLNLTLEILGRRDDGYHELSSVMQTLGLADDVRVTTDAPAPGLDVTGPYAAGTPTDTGNLAWRAAEELAARAGRDTSRLGIALVKRIPPAGGLGGGASDAATVLRLLQRAWQMDDADVLASAVAVGSDEAFFLHGGTGLVEGRGERVTPLAPLPPHGVVLFVPGETIERKTARLFEAVSTAAFDSGASTASLAAALPCAVGTARLVNGFERVAFDLFPGLRELRGLIEAAIGEPVRLCGAGPTLFWIGPTTKAGVVAGAARGLNCTVIETATAASPWAR